MIKFTYLKETTVILFSVLLLCAGCKEGDRSNSANSNAIEFNVMTWNIWGRLNLDPKYTIDGKTARVRVIDIIKECKADIITMTETYGSAADIADSLAYNYFTPASDANLAIFSRYPIVEADTIKDLSPFSFIGATIKLPNKAKLKVYNIWLTSGGRHIVEIKNDTLSDDEFNKGDAIRYEHVQELLNHEAFKNDVSKRNEIPIIIAGDFNCVSHLDYTPETKRSELNYSRILENKTSLAMAEVGFVDTYRFIHPDITAETLGHTWTTVGMGYEYKSNEGFVPIENNPSPQYRNPYTRIDYIYSAGESIQPINSKTILHHSSNLSRSFPEFPSDHGAVLTTFKM